MSWLPKRDKLDPVQASAIDFAAAQEGNSYIRGEAGTGKSVVLARRNDGIIERKVENEEIGQGQSCRL